MFVLVKTSNPGGGIPFVGEDTGIPLWKDSADNLVGDLSVGGLDATSVQFNGPDGPVTMVVMSPIRLYRERR